MTESILRKSVSNITAGSNKTAMLLLVDEIEAIKARLDENPDSLRMAVTAFAVARRNHAWEQSNETYETERLCYNEMKKRAGIPIAPAQPEPTCPMCGATDSQLAIRSYRLVHEAHGRERRAGERREVDRNTGLYDFNERKADRRQNSATISTDNTESAALLAVRVRELEKQLEAADKMREAFKNSADAVARRDTLHLAYEMDQAIAAYDAARGK